jgi:hypothetical protein
MIRLILTPSKRPERYNARREDTGEFVIRSHQPLYDGARELLKRGILSDTLLTIRHAGSGHDSFLPKPIEEWAKWTIWEGRRGSGLKRARWTPRTARAALPSEQGEALDDAG